MFSRVAKQGQLALGRGNDETHCSGPEKNALSVIPVDKKFRKKRQTYLAGTKLVTSKQMRDVRKQRGPVSRKIDKNRNTVGLEKVVPPVPARRIKVLTIISRVTDDGRLERQES